MVKWQFMITLLFAVLFIGFGAYQLLDNYWFYQKAESVIGTIETVKVPFGTKARSYKTELKIKLTPRTSNTEEVVLSFLGPDSFVADRPVQVFYDPKNVMDVRMKNQAIYWLAAGWLAAGFFIFVWVVRTYYDDNVDSEI